VQQRIPVALLNVVKEVQRSLRLRYLPGALRTVDQSQWFNHSGRQESPLVKLSIASTRGLT
jgi:hypothetical protein